MITAYDHRTARIVDGAGVDIILVGDTLSEVVLGHPDTLHVTVEQMAYHESPRQTHFGAERPEP